MTKFDLLTKCEISIHTPREGSDLRNPSILFNAIQFQSTLPARGATGAGAALDASVLISIHTPREGSDLVV